MMEKKKIIISALVIILVLTLFSFFMYSLKSDTIINYLKDGRDRIQNKDMLQEGTWGNISLGSDAEIILNFPPDDYESGTEIIQTNGSVNVTGGALIANISLWHNGTGNWERNQTNSNFPGISETHTTIFDSVVGGTAKAGEQIMINENNLFITNIVKSPSSDATMGYILDDSLSVLTNASFVDNIASFPTPLAVSKDGIYYAVADDLGNSFNNHRKVAAGYNQTDTLLNWTGGIDGSGFATNIWYNILNVTFTTTTFAEQLFNFTISESTLWTYEACDTDGDCGFALENRTVDIDSSPPIIQINNPVSMMGYGILGGNETLNWTITENNFDSAWWEYNGTNLSLVGISNATNFTLETGVYNGTLYANDTLGNTNSSFINWSYAIFQTNLSFNNVTFSAAEESFILDFILDPSITISDAVLNYNFTNYTSNILSIGGGVRLNNTINVPIVEENTNFSFRFFITADGQTYSSPESEQQVVEINITNCSEGGVPVLNMFLLEEKLKTSLLGDIEINIQVLDKASLERVGSSNLSLINVSVGEICFSPAEALDNLYLDAEIKYFSEGYATELYYIQRGDLAEAPINVSLFDLNLNESTEFLVTYQDNNLVFVEDAIVQLQRKYISEDLYEVVEAPLTSDSGTVVLHIDLDTNKYKATIVKNGVVLDVFDNLVFSCENELSGQCNQQLLGAIDSQNDIPVADLTDFSYAITQSNDTITTIFSIPSGVPSSVNVLLTQIDQFNNSYTCNQTVFSSAGAIECGITPTIGDSFLGLEISKSDELQAQKSYVVQEDLSLEFLGNNYFILFILMLSLVGMAFTSPEWIIINGVLTMVVAGALYLANGVNFVIGLGNLIWLVIAAVILILKQSQQEDR